MDGYIGEIRAFAFTFAPRGWLLCDGSLLQLRANTALFSILGTQYGGDGRTTFALPKLNGSTQIGQGAGPGLSSYTVGNTVGSETVALQFGEMPAHNHVLHGKVVAGSTSGMVNAPTTSTYLSRLLTSAGPPQAGYSNAALVQPVTMAQGMVGITGSATTHENRQPALPLIVCVCAEGVFPQRP